MIRVAVLGDKIAPIAGFGTGLAGCSKDKRSRAGLNLDIDQENTILFRKNCESVTIVTYQTNFAAAG